MPKLFTRLYKYKNRILRVFLFFFSVLWLMYLFPKKQDFKYEFSKGQLWNYEDLYAPFDFGVVKTEKEINQEKQNIKKSQKYYFEKNKNIFSQVQKDFNEKVASLNNLFLKKKGLEIIEAIYDKGYVSTRIFPYYLKDNDVVVLKSGKKVTDMPYGIILNFEKVHSCIDKFALENHLQKTPFAEILKETVLPDVFFHEELTQKSLKARMAAIPKIKALIVKGSKIIGKGDIINDNSFQKLHSLKQAFDEQVSESEKNNYYLILGYFFIINIVFYMFFSYLFYLRKKIYHNVETVRFLVVSILCKATLSILVLKQESNFVYIIPYCLLPIMIRAFFDLNTSLITHLTTIMILAPIMPQSFNFAFLQISAGAIGLLSRTNIYKRMNLFIISIKILLVYLISFCGLMLIQEGSLNMFNAEKFFLFFTSSILVLFAHPLIYLFEKLFGFTSNLSLLELSDTNGPLLRLLSQKAPGTLQHSLSVAYLAEETAREINADALLVRIGALYHDIGKTEHPTFFTENQRNIVNPHEELSPEKSAEIILEHVNSGIELAKKHNLPDKIIDFIRTHHGNTLVYYFYKKYKELHPDKEVDVSAFQYKGPKPFSKETAILMICDSVEAASKSLQNLSSAELENLVEEIVNKQMRDHQFSNADITLKEIKQIKNIIKKKLPSIYHTRIEYPN